MSLMLACNRDHALLAMVVQEARAAADPHDASVTRRAVQLATYFLKALAVPMGYRFDYYGCRPFCDEIVGDIEWLVADEVIEDRSEPEAKTSDYAPARALPELLSMHAKSLEPLRPQVRRVIKTLAPFSPQRLELLAALDLAYRWKRASGGPGPWKDRAISRFLQFRGGQFTQREVSQAYDALAHLGLIDP